MKYFLTFLSLLNTVSYFGQTPFKCGSVLLDERDNQSYQTVQIGAQCWMKQNLNIGKNVKNMQQTDNGVIEKTCYENKEALCEILGGLYSWNEAMQYQNTSQGTCPAGWHIPSKDEWQELISFLGPEDAGQKIKASLGTPPLSWDGTNESGFTAFPAGAANHGYFKRVNQWALFWTSTPENNERAWFSQLDSYYNTEPPKYKKVYLGNYYLKSNGFSVRCIKND